MSASEPKTLNISNSKSLEQEGGQSKAGTNSLPNTEDTKFQQKSTNDVGVLEVNKNNKYCILCNMKFRCIQRHLTTKKHIQSVIKTCQNDKEAISDICTYYCEVCKIKPDNIVQDIIRHKLTIEDGKGEWDNVFFKCLCCKSIMQGYYWLLSHIETEEHTDQLKQLCRKITQKSDITCFSLFSLVSVDTGQPLDFLAEQPFIYIYSFELSDSNYIICSVCNVHGNVNENFMTHLIGKRHRNRLKEMCCSNKKVSCKDDLVKTDNKVDKLLTTLDRLTISNVEYGSMCKTMNVAYESILPNDVFKEIEHAVKKPPNEEQKKFKKNIKPEKSKSINDRFNVPYNKKFLKLEEQMFDCYKASLELLQESLKLSFIEKQNEIYCIPCKTSISRKLFYAHLYFKRHLSNIKEMKKTKYCAKLVHHVIQKFYTQNVDTFLAKCYPCKKHLENETIYLEHIRQRSHKANLSKWNIAAEYEYNTMVKELQDVWYNIQNYCCVVNLCTKKFNLKMDFLMHLVAHKDDDLLDNTFNFCMVCRILWLGPSDTMEHHCSDVMHRYLLSNKDYEVRQLSDRAVKLLKKAENIASSLMATSKKLMDDKSPNIVIQSLEECVKEEYPNAKVYPFGSRIIGLGFADSDIDLYLDHDGTMYHGNTQLDSEKVLKKVQKCLKRREDTWEVYRILTECRIPIIKLKHRPTGLDCDISFLHGLSVEKSKFMRSYTMNYPVCHKLLLFLKKWISLCDLPCPERISSFAFMCMVIFYLQKKQVVPVVIDVLNQNKTEYISGWKTAVTHTMSFTSSDIPFEELILDFFDFYAEFDYRYNVICPLVGYEVRKQFFIPPENLPKAMRPYIEKIRSDTPVYFRIDSALCVQDPFELSHNLTKAVQPFQLTCFKTLCRQSASILRMKS